ncbi:unnamed protein product [Discula destructiva]
MERIASKNGADITPIVAIAVGMRTVKVTTRTAERGKITKPTSTAQMGAIPTIFTAPGRPMTMITIEITHDITTATEETMKPSIATHSTIIITAVAARAAAQAISSGGIDSTDSTQTTTKSTEDIASTPTVQPLWTLNGTVDGAPAIGI